MAREPKTISIAENNGLLTIDPYGIYLSKEDTVQFNTHGRTFKVVFHDESPFSEQEISDDRGRTPRSSAARGNYPYAVAIVSQNGKEVFLEADCPSVIIR